MLISPILRWAVPLALAFGSGWAVNGWRLASTYQAERAQAAHQQTQAVQAARHEEQRRVHRVQEIADAAHIQLTTARADADRADAAAERLRQRIQQLVADAARHPAAAGASPSADDPIGMLADVLSRADARAGILADFADQAHAAGTACQRTYDALTTTGH